MGSEMCIRDSVRTRRRESRTLWRAARRNHRRRTRRGRQASTRPCRLRRLHPEQLVGLAEHLPEGGHRRARPAASRRQDDTRLGQSHDRNYVYAPLRCGPDRDADDDDQHRRHAAGWPAVGPDAVAQRRPFLRRSRPRQPAGRQVDGGAGQPRRCVRRRLEHHAARAVPELRRLAFEGPVAAAHTATRRVTRVRRLAASRCAWRPESGRCRRNRAWPSAGGLIARLRAGSRWQAGQ